MKRKVAFAVMRISVGVVFLIFAIGKFQDDIWASTIRNMSFFQGLPWSPDTSVLLVGILEIVVAVGLMAGIFTRWFCEQVEERAPFSSRSPLQKSLSSLHYLPFAYHLAGQRLSVLCGKNWSLAFGCDIPFE